MKLSEKAILAVNNQNTRLKLALALGFTEAWIISLLNKNKDNGPLTTVTAVQIIKNETGLKQKDILEEEAAETIN